MNYPTAAIEACEALSHPLPHPTMPIEDDERFASWLNQAEGGAKVDTQHTGPIEMFEPERPLTSFRPLVLMLIGMFVGVAAYAVRVWLNS